MAQPLEVASLAIAERWVAREETVEEQAAASQPSIEEEPHVERILAHDARVLVHLAGALKQRAVEVFAGIRAQGRQLLIDEPVEHVQGGAALLRRG